MAATAGRPTDRIEMRVAASVAHLGLILAPLLALTITTGVVPAITLDEPVLAGRPRRRLHPLDFGPGIAAPPFGQVHPGWRGPGGGWSGRR
jgi:hypothetical protein